jgi:hypothetical protein
MRCALRSSPIICIVFFLERMQTLLIQTDPKRTTYRS